MNRNAAEDQETTTNVKIEHNYLTREVSQIKPLEESSMTQVASARESAVEETPKSDALMLQHNEDHLRVNSPVTLITNELQGVKFNQNETEREPASLYLQPTFSSHLVHPVPKRAPSINSIEAEQLLENNQDDPSKVQRCLFPKSPSTNRPGTALRRTQSDYGICKIRKSITFETDPMVDRLIKRPMCIHNSIDIDPIKSIVGSENLEQEKDFELSKALLKYTTNDNNVTKLQMSSTTSPVKENLRPEQVNEMSNGNSKEGSRPSSNSTSPRKRTGMKSRQFSWRKDLEIQEHTNGTTITAMTTTTNLPIPTITLSTAANNSWNDNTVLVDASSQSSEPCGSPPRFNNLTDVTTISDNFDILNCGTLHPCILPISEAKNSLPYVTPHIVAQLLNGDFGNKKYTIIDCRYEYEYQGGHIRNALNIKTPHELEVKYLKTPSSDPNQILIFHCEFSSYRGPNLCQHLRTRDRQHHFNCYPQLYYPQIYVLQGGFKSFFELYPQLCDPSNYVPMLDPRFKEELKEYKQTLRAHSAAKVKRSMSTGNIGMFNKKH